MGGIVHPVYTDVGFQRVARRVDDDVAVAIVCAVVGKGGQAHLHVERTVVVAHGTADACRDCQCEREVEEVLQPVAAGDGGIDAEVVVPAAGARWQTGQGGELVAHHVDETLGQRFVVVAALQPHLGEVAVERDHPLRAVAPCFEEEVADGVFVLCRLHGKVVQSHRTVELGQRAAREVGCEVETEIGAGVSVADVECRGIEAFHLQCQIGMSFLPGQIEVAFQLEGHIGVFHTQRAVERAFTVGSVDVYVAVSVGVIVQFRHHSLKQQIGHSVPPQCAVDVDTCGERAQARIVEQPP